MSNSNPFLDCACLVMFFLLQHFIIAMKHGAAALR